MIPLIAVIGGTGELGRGLVVRWALGGERVIIGSRSREKAEKIAKEVGEEIGREVEGLQNAEAVRRAELIVLSVPFEGLEKIVEEIKPAMRPGKIVVSVIVPLKGGKTVEYSPPPSGSAAEEVARLLPGARVVSAFHTVGAKQLQELQKTTRCDVVICGDDPEAKKRVMGLVRAIPGMRPIDGGPLRNSRLVESTVALLMELTRRHKSPGVSFRFEGL